MSDGDLTFLVYATAIRTGDIQFHDMFLTTKTLRIVTFLSDRKFLDFAFELAHLCALEKVLQI